MHSFMLALNVWAFAASIFYEEFNMLGWCVIYGLNTTFWYCLKSINVYTTAAMEYLLGHPAAKVDENAFEQASGVGVIVSPEQIESGVNSVILIVT